MYIILYILSFIEFRPRPTYESNSSLSAPADNILMIVICVSPRATLIIIICDSPRAKIIICDRPPPKIITCYHYYYKHL